jgi:hypothetical protein
MARDIFKIVDSGQPSYYHYMTAVSVVKWRMAVNVQEAGDLSFLKIEELIYYAGRTPLISHFY